MLCMASAHLHTPFERFRVLDRIHSAEEAAAQQMGRESSHKVWVVLAPQLYALGLNDSLFRHLKACTSIVAAPERMSLPHISSFAALEAKECTRLVVTCPANNDPLGVTSRCLVSIHGRSTEGVQGVDHHRSKIRIYLGASFNCCCE